MITKEEIESVLQIPVLSYDPTRHAACAPGMKHRHYAPQGNLILLDSWNNFNPHPNAMVLSISTPPLKIDNHHFVSSENLYALLRKADDNKIQSIYVVFDEMLRKNHALSDRVVRASQK